MGLLSFLSGDDGTRHGKDYVIGVSHGSGKRRMYLSPERFKPDADHLYLLEMECARLAYELRLDSAEELEFVIEPRSERFDPVLLKRRLAAAVRSIDAKVSVNSWIKREYGSNPLMEGSPDLKQSEENDVYYRSARRSGERLAAAIDGYLRQSKDLVP